MVRLIPYSPRSTLFSDTIQTGVLLELPYNFFKITIPVVASYTIDQLIKWNAIRCIIQSLRLRMLIKPEKIRIMYACPIQFKSRYSPSIPY
jgi:hypothetical protein